MVPDGRYFNQVRSKRLKKTKQGISRSVHKAKKKSSTTTLLLLTKKRIHQPTTTVTSIDFCVIASAIIQKLYRELRRKKTFLKISPISSICVPKKHFTP